MTSMVRSLAGGDCHEARIELLGTQWLDSEHETVESFRRLARRLGIELGWHYPVDLAWVADKLRAPSGLTILDAGAGMGALQWWLADHGAVVISADRQDRSEVSPRFRASYRIEGMDAGSLRPLQMVACRRLQDRSLGLARRYAGWARAVGGRVLEDRWPKRPGTVIIYHSDLTSLARLSDESVDAVVSVSALEHNDLKSLAVIIDELWRVLRPGGIMLLTVSASQNLDWYHSPSSGWCLTERSLRRYFRIPARCPSNFESYATLLSELKASHKLQAWLSPLYARSGQNGMPWGVWDPKYVPVGILKVKRGRACR